MGWLPQRAGSPIPIGSAAAVPLFLLEGMENSIDEIKNEAATSKQTSATHHSAFDLCRSNECRVQRLPFLTFEAISSAVLDLKHAFQMHTFTAIQKS